MNVIRLGYKVTVNIALLFAYNVERRASARGSKFGQLVTVCSVACRAQHLQFASTPPASLRSHEASRTRARGVRSDSEVNAV